MNNNKLNQLNENKKNIKTPDHDCFSFAINSC